MGRKLLFASYGILFLCVASIVFIVKNGGSQEDTPKCYVIKDIELKTEDLQNKWSTLHAIYVDSQDPILEEIKKLKKRDIDIDIMRKAALKKRLDEIGASEMKSYFLKPKGDDDSTCSLMVQIISFSETSKTKTYWQKMALSDPDREETSIQELIPGCYYAEKTVVKKPEIEGEEQFHLTTLTARAGNVVIFLALMQLEEPTTAQRLDAKAVLKAIAEKLVSIEDE
jgi:hypothetical protein